MSAPEFREWPKIARWNRDVTITEKIDGTNACVVVTPDGVWAQSRSKIITPEQDNHGFARWVAEHAELLSAGLGEGYHYGEWFGSGIQKRGGYGLTQGVKRLALFNVERYADVDIPGVCVVPVLWRGTADRVHDGIRETLSRLRELGSLMAPGNPEVVPEGIVIYHHAARQLFKVTLEKDAEWKGKAA